MDITEIKQKADYNDDVKKLLKILKFDKINLELKGSYNLKIIDYYADYDFFTIIRHKYSINEIYSEFSRIMNEILINPDIYFIEFKTQDSEGNKFKWRPNDNFKYSDFQKHFGNNNEYCKLDLILWSDNKFIEASANYWFKKKVENQSKMVKEINDNISELKKEQNYFKVLKRFYLLEIMKPVKDNIKIDKLISVFNSDLGKIYKDINNIDAIELIKKNGYDKEALTKKRIEINLDEIKYYANYKNQYDKNKKELNNKAKKIYNDLK